MRVCNKTSAHFSIGRGVRQGSVLSPTLFNIVLDSLLTRLKSMQLGLNINGLFLGAFAHADDLRAHSTSLSDAKTQVSVVNSYTDSRGLKLCPEKCAVVIAAPVSSESMSTVDVGDVSLPVEQSVKCLGIYLASNQSSKTSIEENLVRREEPSSLMVALAFSMACLILYLLAVFLSAVLFHLSSMGLRFGYSTIHYCLNWYLSKLIWERGC